MQNYRLYDALRKRAALSETLATLPVAKDAVNLALLIPDFFMLLLRISRDGSLPRRHRMLSGAALAYLASPLDIIPGWLFGPAGVVDDLTVTLFVMRQVIVDLPEEVVLRHWSGDARFVPLMRRMVDSTDAWMRAGMRFKLYAWMRDALGKVARS